MQRFETDPPLENVGSLNGVFISSDSNEGSTESQLEIDGRMDRFGGSVRVGGTVDRHNLEGKSRSHSAVVDFLPSATAEISHEDTGRLNTDWNDTHDRVSLSSTSPLTSSQIQYDEVDESSTCIDNTTLLQAIVFIEDAVTYRSVHHKVDPGALHWYRIYFSWPVRWFVTFIIILLHLLAFLEYPSSLSWTSDILTRGPRIELPCGGTEGIEFFCLIVLLFDLTSKAYFIGKHRALRSKWLLAYGGVLLVSLIDWTVSVCLGCSETVRVRRMLRPFFILQNSSLMKKTFNCLRRTLPEVASVLCLLAFHLYVFTLFGMLIFPKPKKSDINYLNKTDDSLMFDEGYVYLAGENATNVVPPSDEGSQYFRTLTDSLLNLLVLLTTANNPDVTMPAYKENRLYEFYFMAFLIVGLYCFMNMLTAVIYNQFRGYFLTSMQSSLFRRRIGIRAAFEVLRHRKQQISNYSSINTVRRIYEDNPLTATHITGEGVLVRCLRPAIEGAYLHHAAKETMLMDLDSQEGCVLNAAQFQDVFSVLDKDLTRRQRPPIIWSDNRYFCMIQVIVSHKYFTYIGNLIAVLNVILISFELATRYDHSLSSSHSALGVINLIFIIYYLLEQSLKLAVLKWKRYVWNRGNVFDGLVTVVLVIVEIFYLARYGTPFSSKESVSTNGMLSLWNIVRITNILIMVRLFRIIPHIKAMTVVASTLFDLVRNMKSFGGVLVAIYYSFAILGIELFNGKITAEMGNSTNSTPPVYTCGTYKQLDYWANNFDDFAAAIVVLWDVMVVNNWHVFLQAYTKVTNGWSDLYFIAWWLLSVVIVLNLFTAIILENFIMKWDRSHVNGRQRNRAQSFEESTYLMSVHEMFRDSLREPADNELLVELRQHRFLKLER